MLTRVPVSAHGVVVVLVPRQTALCGGASGPLNRSVELVWWDTNPVSAPSLVLTLTSEKHLTEKAQN